MEDIIKIMTHVLSGEASPEEHDELKKWLDADKKNQSEFEQMKVYWSTSNSQNNNISGDVAWESMQKRIHAKNTQNTHTLHRKWYAIAASIAVLITLPLLYLFIQGNSEKYNVLQAVDSRQEFTLDDGTRVTLNKNSRLQYSYQYGKTDRNVVLEGEGFFEVTKDTARPFEVKMKNVKITVLGTVFTAKSDNNSDEIIASLLEGSIRFDSPNGQIMIKPDQQVIYNKTTNQTTVRTTNAENDAAWRNGQFRYRSISFATLINDLERNYQVDIKILNNELKESTVIVTAAFNEEQTIPEIFEIINGTIPIQWSGSNGHYTIK